MSDYIYAWLNKYRKIKPNNQLSHVLYMVVAHSVDIIYSFSFMKKPVCFKKMNVIKIHTNI